MPGKVLVTGGTGFIASWVIAKLLQQGYEVRTTIRKPDAETRVRRAIASQVNISDRLSSPSPI